MITSNRDPIFISKFWQDLMAYQGVKLQLSSAYHPQIDGKTEVVNRCVETYLRCMFLTNQKNGPSGCHLLSGGITV